jgi:hypothetical protein
MRVQMMVICLLMGFAALQSCKTAGGSSTKDLGAAPAGENAKSRVNTSANGVKKLNSQDSEKFMLALAPISGSSSFDMYVASCTNSMGHPPYCSSRVLREEGENKMLPANSAKVLWDMLDVVFHMEADRMDFGTMGYVIINIHCAKSNIDGTSLCTFSRG